MNIFNLSTAFAISAFMLGGTPSAQAAESDAISDFVEEVVVTARKRSESIYEVPIAISVISDDLIEKLGAHDFTDLLRSVPGLTAYQNGPGRTRLYIRGIANGAGNDNDTQNQETVSIYLDEIPISLGAMNPELALFDLERVEVLRGPQGTLYGAGSMAGTIRQVSKKPDLNNREAKIEAGISTIKHGTENFTGKALVNLPLIEDTLAIRASAYFNDNGGYIDNVTTGKKDINDGTSKGAKISMRYEPNEQLTADFNILIHDYSDNGRPEDEDILPYLSRSNVSFDGFDDEMQIYNMTLNYDLGWGEITSSSSYFNRKVINRRALDLLFVTDLPPGITPHELIDTTKLDVFSQEIRLSSSSDNPLQWTVGTYFDNKKTLYLNTFPAPGADAVIGAPSEFFGAPKDTLFFGFEDLTVKTYAFFGEAYYTLDRFTFTAGLRYFNWKQKIEFYQSGLFNGGANSDPRPNGKTDGVNPKASVSFDVNEHTMLFVSASRGYRYGGINGAIPAAVCADDLTEVELSGGDPRFFGPDKLWNYELGAKGTVADGAVSYSASYFLIKWDNMQTSKSLTCGFGFRENVGEVTSKGVEIEMQANIGEYLTVGFNGSYTNAELDEAVKNLAASKGDQVPYVPKYAFNTFAELNFPVIDNWSGFAWADVQYIGDRHTEFNHVVSEELNPNYRKMNAFTSANLRLGIRNQDLEVSLFANNLFDSGGQLRALRRPPYDPDAVIRIEPRTVGLNVRMHF